MARSTAAPWNVHLKIVMDLKTFKHLFTNPTSFCPTSKELARVQVDIDQKKINISNYSIFTLLLTKALA